MSWQDLPKPDGVGGITESDDGFEVSISIPSDEDGYFGRECPSCEAPFKMRSDEYKALPDEIELTCPYCGHREEHSAFMSAAQHARAMAAAEGLVEQWMHGQLNDMLGSTFGRRSPGPAGTRSSASTGAIRREPLRPCASRPTLSKSRRGASWSAPPAATITRSTAPPRSARSAGRARPARRCSKRSPPRGRRSRSRTVSARTSARRSARRVPDAQQHTKGKGNLFQRLDDTAARFSDHADVNLVELACEERWQRLKRTFARRHVLIHNGGIVDDKFVSQVPDSGLRPGQRLVVRRADAAQALDDLEAVVHALANV